MCFGGSLERRALAGVLIDELWIESLQTSLERVSTDELKGSFYEFWKKSFEASSGRSSSRRGLEGVSFDKLWREALQTSLKRTFIEELKVSFYRRILEGTTSREALKEILRGELLRESHFPSSGERFYRQAWREALQTKRTFTDEFKGSFHKRILEGSPSRRALEGVLITNRYRSEEILREF